MNKWIKLKYVATSFSTAQKQSDVLENGEYKVYGASGLVGYLDTFGADTPYIGIVKDGAGVGRTNIYNAYTSLLGTMAYIVPRNPDNTNLHFLQYAISALNLGETAGDKATIPHIYFSVYGNKYILHVPVDTQKKIATYLNQKCDKVNSLIQNVQTQIEKLKAYKQSLVTEVVTKGLNPTVPMKDSGVDWIGEVPEHWQITRLKHLYDTSSGSPVRVGPFGSALPSSELTDEGLWVYNQRTVIDQNFSTNNTFVSPEKASELTSFSVYPKDILITTRGSIGKTAIVPNNAPKGILHPCVIRFRIADDKMDRVLLSLIFNETNICQGQIMDMSNSTTIEVLYSYSLKEIWIPCPPTYEQVEILQQVKKIIQNFARLIAIKQAKIEKLEQYKRSLIYEYVTGKKEVV